MLLREIKLLETDRDVLGSSLRNLGVTFTRDKDPSERESKGGKISNIDPSMKPIVVDHVVKPSDQTNISGLDLKKMFPTPEKAKAGLAQMDLLETNFREIKKEFMIRAAQLQSLDKVLKTKHQIAAFTWMQNVDKADKSTKAATYQKDVNQRILENQDTLGETIMQSLSIRNFIAQVVKKLDESILANPSITYEQVEKAVVVYFMMFDLFIQHVVEVQGEIKKLANSTPDPRGDDPTVT